MEMEQDQWVIYMNDEVNKLGTNPLSETEHWEKRCIYKVPAYVADLNKKAYKPHAVSFGPYHHGEHQLVPMEEHKHRALVHFLKRSGKPLQLYMDSLADVAQDLKDAYDSLDPAWQRDTKHFLQLMMLDGCFMLEILRTATQTDYDEDHLAPVYAENDPIFSKHGKLHILPYIKRDMLMLENQLPMLVLQKIMAVEDNKTKLADENLILRFFGAKVRFPSNRSMVKCLHVLDAYRESLIWQGPKIKKKSQKNIAHETSRGGDEMIRSAMELNEAGIRFKKSKSRSLRDISFKGGVLRLPLIMVDDATESVCLNLMAYERFHVGVGNDVTSYIFFMDNMIDSALDVSLLHSHGIIQNAVGSDKAVAKLFNSLSKDVALEPNSNLDAVQKNVNRYCRKPWNKWRANLFHTYFTNPWAILSVVAAIFLFALTIIQTIFTVYPQSG